MGTLLNITAKPLLFLALLLGLFFREVCACEVSWERYGRICYKHFTSSANYDTAKSNCESLGGHMVTTKTEDVHNFTLTVRPQGDMWIGLKDLAGNAMSNGPSGNWQWEDSGPAPLAWQNWASTGFNGPCIHQYGGEQNKWERSSCTSMYPYMCQKPLGNNDGLWRRTRQSKQADSNMSFKTETANTLTYCAMICLGEPTCIAFNIGPSVMGSHQCVMFDTYGKDDSLYTHSEGWNYYEFVR